MIIIYHQIIIGIILHHLLDPVLQGFVEAEKQSTHTISGKLLCLGHGQDCFAGSATPEIAANERLRHKLQQLTLHIG